jgi:hypothetical protein
VAVRFLAGLKALYIGCADDLSIAGLASLTRLTGLSSLEVSNSGHNYRSWLGAKHLAQDDEGCTAFNARSNTQSKVRAMWAVQCNIAVKQCQMASVSAYRGGQPCMYALS